MIPGRAEPTSTQPAVGLLIVHGIGNQPVSALRDALAARLADTGVPPSRRAVCAAESAGAPGRQATPALEVQEVRVGGAPVLEYEANWADVSHPDNPPKVRDSSDVVTEFYRTVRAAWQSASYISPDDTATGAAAEPKPMLVWLGIAAIFNALLILGWRLDWSAATLLSELNESPLVLAGIGLGIMGFSVYSLVQAIRKWNSRKLEVEPRYRMWVLVQLPVVILWGFYRPFFFLLGAEMLLFFSLAVFTAYPVNLLGWLLAHPFRGAGHVFSRFGLHSPAKWIHRLGCVMVVLPAQSYLQAVKATGNLFSILFSEKGVAVRLNAFLWFLWVYLGFLVLLVVSEILVLTPLALFLLDAEGGGGRFHVSTELIVVSFVVLLPLYFLLLKVLLPAIDLVLDVSNYHLASAAEREEYFVRLDRGASALAQGGCKEIHLLAHSLGSVIAYDWLHARKPKSYPVVTFHTIGSPLDKFWYIDHGQPGRGRGRRSLEGRIAGAWINHWAFSDPVSGKLHRYDAPTLRVTNNRLRGLGAYLWSHGRYWTNESVIKSVRASFKERAA